MEALAPYVDLTQPTFWLAAGVIVALPTAWNIVARREYHTKFLTQLLGGPYRGCYFLASCIFAVSLGRDYLFNYALDFQPKSALLGDTFIQLAANALFVVANILVISSMLRLGITGTYLGDYFGILMKSRVTQFPFNVMENPMYNGATLNFLALALWCVHSWACSMVRRGRQL